MLHTFLLAAVLSADTPAPPLPTTPAAATLPAAATTSPVEPQEEPKLDPEVEQAARDFRIQVYESFRNSREEFDARRQLGTDLLKAWNKAEMPARHRAAVLAWFAEARTNSQLGRNLVPYAELEDLKTLTVSENLPAAAPGTKPADDTGPLLPPFVLDIPKPDEAAAGESIFSRIRALFSAQGKTDAVEPASVKTGS